MTIYNRLVLSAGTCGIVLGITIIVGAWDSMYFFPVLIFSLFAPIGSGFALWILGLASHAGRTKAFYGSLILAVILAVLSSIAFYILVLNRRPVSLLQEFPLLGFAERIGLVLLTACLLILTATVAVGVRVRTRLPRK